MAKIELEGMQELIDKVNKLGAKGEIILKKTLDKAETYITFHEYMQIIDIGTIL